MYVDFSKLDFIDELDNMRRKDPQGMVQLE